jgi:rifampicin phosphotransferase
MSPSTTPAIGAWIHFHEDRDLPEREVGGKAHQLARLDGALRAIDPALTVPPWFAIDVGAFDALVRADRPWPATSAEADARRAEVHALALPESLRAGIQDALRRAGLEHAWLAVRSSARGEDAASASFAGQFDSVLGVRADDPLQVAQAIRQVWASAFNAHAAAYAGGRGAGNGVHMAVIVQEMAPAAAAGVAFSADPVTGARGTAVVSAVYGLGEGLVSGELDADTHRVASAGHGAGIVTTTLAHKVQAVRMSPTGNTRLEPVAEALRDRPALADDEVRRIATCARALADAFGAPQDIEWALVETQGGPRRLVILQARPITTLPATVPAPAGERRVWDNSNIVESYGGVTTPLTFSFAREVYDDVYRQFCLLMGVPRSRIEANRPVFANMLGLVRGRVYYQLLNWYRVLALLPGFAFNRGFMERMMGVRERLTDEFERSNAGGRVTDLLRLAAMVLRMVWRSGRLGHDVPAFHARVESSLAPLANQDLATRSPDELVALYRRLERELLQHWQAPLVNDFFAMIFFGVLCRLVEKWLPEAPPTIANDLLCGEGGIISTEPARRVMALAGEVRDTPELFARFAAEPNDHALWSLLAMAPEHAAFHQRLRGYLARFGDRCMNELKLETITLAEDPAFLIQMIRAYAARGAGDPEAARAHEVMVRREAESVVRARLGAARHALFLWVLAQARRRVRDRENLRFERTRVFGTVRRIVTGLGGHLARSRRLDSPRDVFMLTREELFAHVEGTAVTADLRALVSLRRMEFDAWTKAPAPPDRFETLGPPDENGIAAPPAVDLGAGTSLRGTGCCPGVIRAPVCIVRDPRDAHDLAGRILVAERTDPGWTLLFPTALGLLVERGSLLSHSAIVAREMGLPCVVGIASLLGTLRDGEVVEMDGTSGVVRRVSSGDAHE